MESIGKSSSPTLQPLNETKTQITFEKTSCYFCNEWLESQTFTEHIIHCGQVLEKCPQSCNAYFPRKRMRSHLKDCPKVKITQRNESDNNEIIDLCDYENRMLLLEQDITSLRSVLNEEIKQRLHLITDVGSLRKHNQISDEWIQKVGDVLSALKRCVNEETSARCTDMKSCNEDITRLYQQYKSFQDWKASIAMRLDQLHNQIIEDGNRKEDFFATMEKKETLFKQTTDNLEMEISKLRQQILGISYGTGSYSNELESEIIRLGEMIEERDMKARIKLKCLEDEIIRIYNDLQSKFVSHTELNAKQVNLDYEVKSMKNIVCETEEKCEKLERIITDMDKAIHQTHQGLADLEVHLLLQNKLQPIQNTRGHLIWKINGYSGKFHQAKQYDTMIQSPLFCNKQYGYTLRLDVHLNGLGTWKGRNIIATLTVVQGEYDTLLEWPCKLQADIILRDQCENPAESQDYIKTTVAKKKNEDYHSNQYIHIPHKVIESRNFIRNDAIFFDVRVHKTRQN